MQKQINMCQILEEYCVFDAFIIKTLTAKWFYNDFDNVKKMIALNTDIYWLVIFFHKLWEIR